MVCPTECGSDCMSLQCLSLQRFSNVDHLSVHQKRHEMKLKFPLMSTGSVAIADQTPTPSRFLGNFLQNWEEVGLTTEIQEISNLTPILNDTLSKTGDTNTNTCNSKSSSADNPFAKSFITAMTSNRLKIPEPRLTNTSSDSPLNTPSIFPNEGLMAIVNAALNTPDTYFQLGTNETNGTIGTSVESTQSSAIGGTTQTTTPTTRQTTTCIASAKPTTNGTSSTPIHLVKADPKRVELSKPLQESNTNTNSHSNGTVKLYPKGQRFQAVPVIRTANTSVNNNISISQTLPNIIISQPNSKMIKTINTTKLRTVPIAQNSKTTAIIAPKMKEPALTVANANSLYKVILKLPDGRSIQLPLVQQPVVTQTAIQPTLTTISNSDKMNEFIAMRPMPPKDLTGATISSQPRQTSSNITSSCFTSIQSKVDATLASLPPKAKPGRKSKFAPEEDPREKKARSLERNRAAAMRCRLKRKHWIDSLEEKADEYEKVNEKLQV